MILCSDDPKKLIKADGTPICAPFQRGRCQRKAAAGGCEEGVFRAHVCAVIKNVDKNLLCESGEHGGMNCSMKK